MPFKRAEDFEGESLTQTYAAAATRKIGYWLRLKVYQRKYGLWSAHPEERATLSTGGRPASRQCKLELSIAIAAGFKRATPDFFWAGDLKL